tara:strand:- start:314 stop:478 length:165 start_codon:yes stop_codon:yes gene_type:complete
MWILSKLKRIHLTIEISDEVREGSIGFYQNFWKGYISQVRGHKVVEYITEGYED